MPTPVELEKSFWKALKSDMTVMLGLVDAEEGHTRPMTAMVEGDGGPIWFFTARDTSIVDALGEGTRAIAAFSAKNHKLFAAVHGDLRIDNDRAVIDRLRHYFLTYKAIPGEGTAGITVDPVYDATQARAVIDAARTDYAARFPGGA